jgi:hypothetical protein
VPKLTVDNILFKTGLNSVVAAEELIWKWMQSVWNSLDKNGRQTYRLALLKKEYFGASSPNHPEAGLTFKDPGQAPSPPA